MGDLIQFRPRSVPDPEHPNLPKAFCDAYRNVRSELAGLLEHSKQGAPRNLVEPIYDDGPGAA